MVFQELLKLVHFRKRYFYLTRKVSLLRDILSPAPKASNRESGFLSVGGRSKSKELAVFP